MIRLGLLAIVVLALACDAAFADADNPALPETPLSMGQPARYRIGAGFLLGFQDKRDLVSGRIFANITPEGYVPNIGIDLFSLEGAVGFVDTEFDYALAYYARVPYLRAGVEYNFRREGFEFVFSIQYALRRGGIFGGGEELRLDYHAGQRETLGGFVINQPHKKYRPTRPIWKWADLPKGTMPEPPPSLQETGLPTDLELSVQEVEHGIKWLDQLLTPRLVASDLEEKAIAYRDHIRLAGHTYDEEDARYHDALDRAFTRAAGGDGLSGRQLAAAAERIIYEQVVIPYNQHFGQNKKPDEPTGLIVAAIESFDEVLQSHPPFASLAVEAAEHQRVLAGEVFRRTTLAIKTAARAARVRWKTSFAVWLQRGRFVWMPLNYGLRPTQYGTQEEWDGVVARLAGHDFTRANRVEYIVNERFHTELKRMIHDTEKYHVLIIHDFRGRNNDGNADVMGWDMVTDGYMAAMREAVEELDRGEREVLPQFLLFNDQNFYQSNGAREIVTYMENIFTDPSVRLDNDQVEKEVAEAHRALVETVRNSPSLAGVSEERLAEIFKVHVNVTNPWDPAFALDISMRDHRKIAFRDVFESDPSQGEGILTGTGIGEHYQPPTWEDRAMAIRGPALVGLKTVARDLVFSQGFAENEVPRYLRDLPYPSDYAAQCDYLATGRWRAPVLLTINETAYGQKNSTAQRAAIYNLAVRGSVLIAIDSLWLSDFWAEMFICAALRGVNVYPLAPSPLNAPSSAKPTMMIFRENMQLLLAARSFFAQELASSGGAIHVGLYAHAYGVDNAVARGSALVAGRDKYPFIWEDLPLNDTVWDLLAEALEQVRQDGNYGSAEGEVNPYVHMKTQMYMTRAGTKILERPEWVDIVRNYIEIRERQVGLETTVGLTAEGLVPMDEGDSIVDRFLKDLAATSGVGDSDPIFSFTIGSMNQDRRGMISDGEVIALISGYSALIGVLDMMFMLATADWPVDQSQLEEIFPDPGVRGTMQKISRYIQDMF